LASDALEAAGGELAVLAAPTIARLDSVLPPTWSHVNPVDLIGDAPGSRYGAALETLFADNGVDAVLVLLLHDQLSSGRSQLTEIVEDTVADSIAVSRQ
jgi:acetyltransferase